MPFEQFQIVRLHFEVSHIFKRVLFTRKIQLSTTLLVIKLNEKKQTKLIIINLNFFVILHVYIFLDLIILLINEKKNYSSSKIKFYTIFKCHKHTKLIILFYFFFLS